MVHDLFSESVDPELSRVGAALIKQTLDQAAMLETGSLASLNTNGDERPTLLEALARHGMHGLLENRPFTRESDLRVMSFVADLIGAIVEHS